MFSIYIAAVTEAESGCYRGPPSSFPGELQSASQHQATIALNFVSSYALSPFIHASISKTCPKVIVTLPYTITAYERFHRNTLLSENRGNMHFPACLADKDSHMT